MSLELQNGDPLLLQDGVTEIELQGDGNPVQPPVDVVRPGDLGYASYPSFFPCPTWEYSQIISGHLERTPFDSGWVRQRKRWREQNSTVELTFTMKTDMFDRWTRWITNNGYIDWFTMYLDRYDGSLVLTEVRMISVIDYVYRSFDTVVAKVAGEMAGPVYGPESGLPTGENDYPSDGGSFCIGVYLRTFFDDYPNAQPDDVIVLTADVGFDVTGPIGYLWFNNDVIIPGETTETYSYTVPPRDNPNVDRVNRIQVNITNPCGEAWDNAIITVPADQACEPYSCSALTDEFARQAEESGAGVYPLLDPNFTPTIPQYFEQVAQISANNSYPRLSSTATGDAWVLNRTAAIGYNNLNANDLDLCDGPRIMQNSEGSDYFSLTNRPTWGSKLPNCSMSIVVRNADLGAGAGDNHLFRCANVIGYRGQTNDDTFGYENKCQLGYVGGNDAIRFNNGNGNAAWDFLVPRGTFESSEPTLITVKAAILGISYPATSFQGSFYDRYSMQQDIAFFASVTNIATGETFSGTHSVIDEIAIVHSRASNPEPVPPMPEVDKPWYSSGNTCYYLQSGMGQFYNFTVNHEWGGEAAGVNTKIAEAPSNPHGVEGDMWIPFSRNFDTYVPPAYCDLP